ELFGGYPWYGTGLRLTSAASWLRPVAHAISWATRRAALQDKLPHKMAKALDLLGRSDASRFGALRRTLEESRRVGLYTSEFLNRAGNAFLHYLERAYDNNSREVLQAMALTDIATYLPEDLLVKVDRMTMAVGLEARSPFLDTRVVELASSIPASLKRTSNDAKKIVKQTFGPLFPPGFLDRPKMGFSLPIDDWLLTDLRSVA